MGERDWRAELDELRGVVQDLSARVAAAEEAERQREAALMLAIARHPASGTEPVPAAKPRRRHLRVLPAVALGLLTRGS